MKKFLSLALCLAMLFSCFAYAAPATEYAESAAEVTESALPEETAKLAAVTLPEGVELNDEKYGKLVAYEDFETSEVDKTAHCASPRWYDEEFFNSFYTTAVTPHFTYEGATTGVVAQSDGNKYLSLSNTAADGKTFYAGFRLTPHCIYKDSQGADQWGNAYLNTPGIYTIVADYKIPDGASGTTSVTGIASRIYDKSDTDGTGGYTSVNEAWKTVAYGRSVTDDTNAIYSFMGIANGKYSTSKDASQSIVYFDNVKVYFKANIKLTFDANGETATVPEAASVEDNADVSLKSYVPADYASDRVFKGWSLTPDGEVLGETAKFTGDTTLYAIWDSTHTHPGYSVAFNNSVAFSNYFNNPNSSAVGPIPGGDIYNAYVSDENGGFQRFTFKSKEGATNFYVGDPKMEAKNFATPLYTKNIKGVSIKYRFNTIPEAIKGTSDSISVYLKLNDPAAYKTDETLTYPNITQRTCVFSNSITFADNDWHTAYIDFAGSTNYAINGVSYKWTDFDRMQNFRFDILNNGYDGLEMDIAGIDFVLSDDVTLDVNKAPVLTSANGADAADYRNGVLNVTYESDPGYTADEFYAAAITDAAKVFSGTDNVEKIENSDGSVTYKMYAVKSSVGTIVYVKSAFTEEVGKITGSVGAAVEYTRKAFDDGENIIPNGDFSNKFYNIWNTADNGSATIENGSLKVVIGTNGNQWIALKASNIMFKPDTKYFYNISIIYNDTEDFIYPFKGVSGLSVYVPFQDGLFDGSKAAFNKQNGKLFLGGGTQGQFLGTTQTVNGVVTIMNENYYSNIARRNNSTSYTDGSKTASSLEALGAITGKTYNTNYFYERAQSWTGTYDKLFKTGADLSLLTAFDKKQFVGDDGAWDSKNSPAAGLTYNLKEYVIKEMWSVNLDANGADGDLETVYLAKDETITLPTTTGYTKAGFVFGGWTVDGAKATTVTATQFKQNVNITAVWNPAYDAPVSYANETTIRTKNPAGLRFIASVADDVANDDSFEYGFIVTRKVLLDAAKIDEADFTHNSAVKKTSGISHDKTTHLTFRNADNNTFFAAALVGIKAANYKDTLLVRPYFKSADGIYYYGVPMSASIYDVAKTVSESAEFASYTDEQKAVVNAILNGSELPTA